MVWCPTWSKNLGRYLERIGMQCSTVTLGWVCKKRGQLDYNAVFICIKSCQLAKNSSSFEMGHLLCTYVVLYPNWASCSLMQLCRLLSRCWMEFAQWVQNQIKVVFKLIYLNKLSTFLKVHTNNLRLTQICTNWDSSPFDLYAITLSGMRKKTGKFCSNTQVLENFGKKAQWQC